MGGVRARMIAVALGAAALLMAALMMAAAGPAAAATPPYAPLDQPGPPLTVPLAQLQASLQCEPSVKDAAVTPVLLNPATGVTAEENYSWNWEPALTKLGIPWCAYTAPNDTLNDIQTSGEYIVYAIRTMYALAHRRIDVMGHSQGGMSMRWALRFWPDTRAMVDDVVGFSGSNHGTTVLSPQDCAVEGCPPADWQQLYQSPFIQALNSYAETFAGISYTELWTHTDEVVEPNGDAATASAAVHTGQGQIADVPTQQVCPTDVYEHLSIGTVDPVAYALAMDALTHPGPADPSRIPASVCSQMYMPGVNPADADTYEQVLAAAPGLTSVAVGPLSGPVAGAPVLHSPPPLDCYVYATCKGADAPTLLLSAPRQVRAGKHRTVRIRVLVQEGAQKLPVPGATVTLAGHRAVTDAQGSVRLTAGFKAGHKYRLRAGRAGCNSAAGVLRAVG